MSSTVVPPAAPFHQWQNFYSGPPPSSYGGYGCSDAYTNNEQLLVGVAGIASQTKQQAANDIARDILRSVDQNGMSNMHSTEQNSAVLAANIERASALNASTTERVNSQLATTVERNGANNAIATERINSQLGNAIERAGANGTSTTERANNQLATAIERNGYNSMSTTERVNSQLATAIERNGANNQWATERSAGEARMTTVVTDAATRQYANDSARDITKAVDANGLLNLGATKDTYAGLLGAVERNAGENRIQTLTSSGILGSTLTDVRHTILNDVNRGNNSIVEGASNHTNNIIKATNDAAWEQRAAASANFKNIGEEQLRIKHDITRTITDTYGNLMLEQQKLGQYLGSKEDNHFAMNQLEMQKVKEGLACQASTQFASSQLEAQKLGHLIASKSDDHFSMTQLEQQKMGHFLSSKADNHFAINQLEMQKVKEGITAQAAQHFASNQLEQQKVKEHLSTQLADAKYEQLKSQQFLADKMSECCCEIKEKVDSVKGHADTLDRDRLRDNLTVSRDEANMLKLNEYNQLYWDKNSDGPCNGPWGGCGYGGYGGYGGWGGRGWGGDERAGYGNVYNNFDDSRRDHRRSPSRSPRRGDDRR